MGIILAFSALVAWGIGDFFIQRSVRRFGDTFALFYITLCGAVGLLPFVISDIGLLIREPLKLVLLSGLGGVIIIAALLDLEALRVGKIAIVEPVYALELPVTVMLASLIIHEGLGYQEIIAVSLLFIGIVLVSVKSWADLRRARLERGVIIAAIATVLMGVANFLVGVGSRETSPLMVNWFMNIFIVGVLAIFLLIKGEWGKVWEKWQQNKGLIVTVAVLDNLAWIAFAGATLYIPIAIATGISESYIALAVWLGMVINKEKVKKHQLVGIILVVIMAVALALMEG